MAPRALLGTVHCNTGTFPGEQQREAGWARALVACEVDPAWGQAGKPGPTKKKGKEVSSSEGQLDRLFSEEKVT